MSDFFCKHLRTAAACLLLVSAAAVADDAAASRAQAEAKAVRDAAAALAEVKAAADAKDAAAAKAAAAVTEAENKAARQAAEAEAVRAATLAQAEAEVARREAKEAAVAAAQQAVEAAKQAQAAAEAAPALAEALPAVATELRAGAAEPAPAAVSQAEMDALFAFLPKVVAKCNGVEISDREVRENMEPQVRQMQAMGHEVKADEVRKYAGELVDFLIDRAMVLQVCSAAGYAPKTEEAEAQMTARIDALDSEAKASFEKEMLDMKVNRQEIVRRHAEEMAIKKWIEEEIEKKVVVGDEEAKKFFESPANAHYFQVPEMLRASHILVKVDDATNKDERAKARGEAEAILKKLRDGADFAALAKAESDCPSGPESGGDLGEFSQGSMVPAFEEALLALKEGEMSGVVETNFGFHVIKAGKRTAAGKRDFAEIKDELKLNLVRVEAAKRIRAQIDERKAAGKVEVFLPKE